MRLKTRLAGAHFAFLTRSSATGRTREGEYLFQANRFFHGKRESTRIRQTEVVNIGHFSQQVLCHSSKAKNSFCVAAGTSDPNVTIPYSESISPSILATLSSNLLFNSALIRFLRSFFQFCTPALHLSGNQSPFSTWTACQL
jgi:hypothetical protein